MASNRHNYQTKKQESNIVILINIILLILFALLAVLFLFDIFTYHFLAFRFVNIILVALFIIVFLISLCSLLMKKRSRLISVLLIIFIIISGLGYYATRSTIHLSKRLNDSAAMSEVEMSIVVPKSSKITKLSQINNVQVPLSSDSSNVQDFINHIKLEKGMSIPTENVDSYQTAYDNLIKGKTQAIVLNSAYSSLLELSDPKYKSNLKTIYTYKITKKVMEDKKTQNSEVFNVYISGIDTYGPISTVSRSDVNIIMTVNTKTHKILLTTTPRDAYVKIPDGGANQYDKLTHSGIYGIKTSMKTLENLYNINIDYYARINFTSFLKLIDLVGGVQVMNDQTFTSLHGNYHFEPGKVDLNSEKALAFVRERYSLEGGDNDRGKNQEKVIAAIINKLASTDSLTNISEIFKSLENSVQTNMSLNTLMTIANAQLSSGSHFSVESQSVAGTGSTGELKSYAMPSSSLYMLQINKDSLDNAKKAIKETSDGKE